MFDTRCSYKRAGVVLSRISLEKDLAPTLFDDMESERQSTLRSRRLMAAVDRLNKGAGPCVLRLASEQTKGRQGHNDGYSSSFGPAKEF